MLTAYMWAIHLPWFISEESSANDEPPLYVMGPPPDLVRVDTGDLIGFAWYDGKADFIEKTDDSPSGGRHSIRPMTKEVARQTVVELKEKGWVDMQLPLYFVPPVNVSK